MSAQVNAIAAYRPFRSLGYLHGNSAQAIAVFDHLRVLSRSRGFKLVDTVVPLDSNGIVDAAAIPVLVRKLKQEGVDCLYIGPETFITAPLQKATTQAALDAGLPTYSALESAVQDSGALFGLFSPDTNLGRFAALKAMRLLDQVSARRR
jgi:putative ABC transport system substrate-binding protein